MNSRGHNPNRGRIRRFLADLAGVVMIAALFLAIYVATP